MVVRGDETQLEGERRWLSAATQVNAGTIKHVQSSLPFRAFNPALITSLKKEGSRLKFDSFFWRFPFLLSLPISRKQCGRQSVSAFAGFSPTQAFIDSYPVSSPLRRRLGAHPTSEYSFHLSSMPSLRASYIYRTGNADVPGTADAYAQSSPYFMSKVKSKRTCFYKHAL
jgi:hypothetical protein